jgi:serine/threonine protein kinase
MTTRDPRSRPPPRPEDGRVARDPTQSLEIDPDEISRDSHPSLAVGTYGERNERTKVESPSARNNPQQSRPSTRPPPVPSRADDPEHRLGTVLGSYRLIELLGKGGMGYVYRAEHTKLGREVALKLLRADYARRRDAVNRFFQEAKTVNRVRHRNIVDVTDFLELDDGTTFIIMELLRGQSLGKWSRTGIDLPRALAVLVQICDGLGAAHAVGVVHRDLKPDNIIITPTSDGAELVKLLDFGVAKLVNRDDEDIGFQTQAGSVIGTPAYMSPEQAGGMAVDQRSDIYSLGAIMYELFCGQPLFRGRSFGEYVRKHLTENPIAPRQTEGGAGMSEQLEALIQRCLAKEPSDRFGHILELRDGLLHLLGGVETHPGQPSGITSGVRVSQTGQLPIHMLPLPAPMATTVPTPQHLSHLSSGHSQVVYGSYSTPPMPRAPVWPWFLGGACAVALGIGAAVWYANRTEAPAPAPAPEAAKHPAPIVEPTPPEPPPPAQVVELRFDSLPSGGVYADGHSAELCRTPCAFNVDLKDGESTERRTFVVRAEGYRDKSVVVEIASPQHEFHVTLERLEPVAGEESQPEPVNTAKRHPGGRPIATKITKKSDKTPDKTEKSEKIDTVDKPAETPKPHRDDGLEKPDPTKKDQNIDPADTHDPFRQK